MTKQASHNSALDQYRNLLADYHDAIDAHTVPAIRRVRAKAAKMLADNKGLSFPAKGSEGYVYTDLDSMYAPDLGVNINRLPVTTDIDAAFKCGLPTISSLLGITVNDTYRPTQSMIRLLPDGVTITPFSTANDDDRAVIERYYGNIAEPDTNNVASLLNTALAQDGLLIRIRKGIVIDKPIQLVNLLQPMVAPDGAPMPVMAVRRWLVVVEENASAKVLICDHDTSSDNDSLATRVTEIVTLKGARLDWYELEESTSAGSRYNHIAARQAEDSYLNLFQGMLRPGRSRNDIEIHLDAPGATLSMEGMAILTGEQSGDNSTRVYHHVPHCRSNQTFKYLVEDNGRGAFEGLILVEHDAHHTEAYQTNRNILASPTARMHTAPQLEIYCDDVKCSHGAATGQLDQQALFYMRSRGIDLPEARSMLMNAFMADVIEKIELVPLRDRLRHIVERRLLGDDARCHDCSTC